MTAVRIAVSRSDRQILFALVCAIALGSASAPAWYMPVTGRWLNRDPIGELGGANLGAFSRNDPGNQVDTAGASVYAFPSGQAAFPDGASVLIGMLSLQLDKELMFHFLFGHRLPFDVTTKRMMYESPLDLSVDLRLDRLEEGGRLVARACSGRSAIDVDVSEASQSGFLMLNYVTFRIRGDLCSDGAKWWFWGSLKPWNDPFDFDFFGKSGELKWGGWKRFSAAAIGAVIAALTGAEPFEVRFHGWEDHSHSGYCP